MGNIFENNGTVNFSAEHHLLMQTFKNKGLPTDFVIHMLIMNDLRE